MTTARTHENQVGPTALGAHQPRIAAPRPDDFVPVGVDADGKIVGGIASGVAEPVGEPYDPADDNIEDVKAYVEAHPGDAEAVFEAELDGKDRSGLTTWLEDFITARDEPTA